MRSPFALALAFLSCLLFGEITWPVDAWAQTPAREVSVRGTSIMLDGKPFIAKGAIFQVFVETAEQLETCRQTEKYCDRHLEARDFYFGRGKYKGQSGLDVAKDWGINTIRLNINQAALDLADPSYSDAYVEELIAATSLARSRGFVVILALFDARNRNTPQTLREANPQTPLDNEVTLAAAKVLARKFGKDKGVMLETLNEPFSPVRRATGWLLWRDGGSPRRGRFAGMRLVGVNAVIQAMRDAGATNVVIVQGLGSFDGFPGGVRDPLNQIVYSVHPFFRDGKAKFIDWNRRFGDFTKSHPVLITAWGINWKRSWCDVTGIDKPRQFLQYLRSKGIGLVVYAMDVPSKLLWDFRTSREETTTLGSSCEARGGIGDLVKSYFTGALPATP